MKRILYTLVATLLSCTSSYAMYDETDFVIDGICYAYTSDMHFWARVVGFQDDIGSDIVLPVVVTHEGITATVGEIADRAFKGCTRLRSVTLTEGEAWHIGYCAFQDCVNLEEVIMPGRSHFEDLTFEGCTSLKRVIIKGDEDANNRSAHNYYDPPFKDCPLEEITMSAYVNITDIPTLKKVTITPYITKLKDGMFDGCEELETLILEDTETPIEISSNEIFSDNPLHTVHLGRPSELTYTCNSINHESYGRYPPFAYKTSLISVTFGERVDSIRDFAFIGCCLVDTLNIPDNIKSIGYCAFRNNVSLRNVIIGDGVLSIGQHAFSGCSIENLTIGANVRFMFGNSFSSNAIRELTIKDGSYALYCYGESKLATSALNKIYMGRNVEYSGESPFAVGNTEREFMHIDLEIGDGVTEILDDCFHNCRFGTIIVGKGLEHIGSGALPGSTEKVVLKDLDAWYNVLLDDSGSFPGGGGSVFYVGDELLVNLIVPNNITSIPAYGFYNVSSMETITFPANLSSIGEYAFQDCTNLKAIYANMQHPEDVTAYQNCFWDYGYPENTYTSCTLYVPMGTKTSYQATEPWKYFLNIEEMELTDIATIEQDDIKDFEIVATYDLNGRKTTGLQCGMNIVKLGNGKTKKVLVR